MASIGGSIEERFCMMATTLSGWGKGKFDDLSKKIMDADKQLKKAQELYVSDSQLTSARGLRRFLRSSRETYWYLRSRSAEVKDGDRNTKYFQHKASQRRYKNEIKVLFDGNCVWQSDEEKVEEIV